MLVWILLLVLLLLVRIDGVDRIGTGYIAGSVHDLVGREKCMCDRLGLCSWPRSNPRVWDCVWAKQKQTTIETKHGRVHPNLIVNRVVCQPGMLRRARDQDFKHDVLGRPQMAISSSAFCFCHSVKGMNRRFRVTLSGERGVILGRSKGSDSVNGTNTLDAAVFGLFLLTPECLKPIW